MQDNMTHAPDRTHKGIGFKCTCGEGFTLETALGEHILYAEDSKPTKEKDPMPDKEPVVETTTSKQEVVKTENQTKTLLPIQRVQSEIIKFGEAKIGKDRAKEFAVHAALVVRENKKLQEAVNKNPDSFFNAYMAAVTLNLMPNTVEGDAFLIPYGEKVQFQVGYPGLIKLARRSGEVRAISAELVFEGEEFDVQFGSDRRIVHKPSLGTDRTAYKNVTHAYGVAKMTNGETQFVVMTKSELDKIQRSAQAKSTDAPWNTWPERQAIKTVLKRLTKVLPSSTDNTLQQAVIYDSLSEAGKLRFDKDSGDIIEGELVEVSSSVKEAIDNATTKEELETVLRGLETPERKKAAPLVAVRLKELQ